MSIKDTITLLNHELGKVKVQLIAVSKTRSTEEIMEAYEAGQRAFGENTAQELADKQLSLPKDIEWHFIGHLQTNKVKFIAPFVTLIHGADSLKLLKEINKEALKNKRIIDCLLQVYIADEETKFGLSYDELIALLRSADFRALENIRVTGLMGIATHTDNQRQLKEEFYELAILFKGIKESFFAEASSFKEISMGMSDDYKLAVEQGSTMVRIGSTIFGKRAIPHWKLN